MAKRTPSLGQPTCPTDGLRLTPLPSGWWCMSGQHDRDALAEAPTLTNDRGAVYQSVPSLRADGPGKNLWRTYELEATRA